MRSLVARRIEETRVRKRVTRQELADKLDTTRMTVWRLENGKVRITTDIAARIAEIFDVSVASLYREGRAV